MKKSIISAAIIIFIITVSAFCVYSAVNKSAYDIYDYKHVSPISHKSRYFDFSVKEAADISDDFIKENTTVIVRSAGERTEQISAELLADFFGRENIILVRNITPLRSAAEISYEIALKKNKKWTLIVDSDVLIIKDRLVNFLKYAELASRKYDDIYCVNGFMISRFLEKPFVTGINLFYTANLPKALKYLKESQVLKIEEYVKIKMSSQEKLLNYRFWYIIGLADFFQHYRDIIRKSVVFCYKWKMMEERKAFWAQNSAGDKEFQYALEGCRINREAESPLYTGYDSVDSRRLNEYIDKLVSENKIKIESQKPLKLNEALNAVNYFKFEEQDTVKIDRSAEHRIYENGRMLEF